MTPLDYLFFLVAIFGHYGLGCAILGVRSPVRAILAGSVIISGVTTPIAWKLASFALPTMQIFCMIGLVLFIWEKRDLDRLKKHLTEARDRFQAKQLVAFTLILAFCALLFIKLQSSFFDYGGEVMVYFAPIVELSQADYASPLRVPTYFPSEMAAFHLTPGIALAALGSYIPSFTMIHAVEILYLISVFVMARFIFCIWHFTRVSTTIFVVVLLALVYICLPEIEAAFQASSFLYAALLLELILLAFLPSEQTAKSRVAAAIMFAVAMPISKLTIAYVPCAIALYYLAVYPNYRWRWSTVLMGFIVLVNVVVILTVPSPFPGQDIFFSIANPFDAVGPSFFMFRFPDALVNGENISKYFINDRFIGPFAIFIYATVKYFALPMLAINRPPPFNSSIEDQNDTRLRRGLEIALLATLFGWTFVRNGVQGSVLQITLFEYAAVAFVAILLIASNRVKRNLWQLLIIFMGAIYLGSGFSPWASYEKAISSDRAKNFVGMSHDEFLQTPKERLLMRIGDEPYSNVGKRAIILGERLESSSVPMSASGKLQNYIYTKSSSKE